MLNIVVPMAGRGSRFANAGYKDPKPLISVGGKPMIQWVIENIRPSQPHRFIFICLRDHLETYPEVPATLRRLAPGCEIVLVDEVTEGAACTVLLARRFIDNADPLMISNADQYVELSIDAYLTRMAAENAEGLIMTFEANHPKWSYCRLRSDGWVSEVVEKKVVSQEATVGIYNFRQGSDFVRAADAMIAANLRVNGEFYVAPTYNQLIAQNGKILVMRTGREYDGMFGLGTPGDLEFFLTTAQFARGRQDSVQESPAQKVAELTRIGVRFFQERNTAGLAALLGSDVRLSTPGREEQGHAAVLHVLSQLNLEGATRQILANERSSVVEFEILRAGVSSFGALVLAWDNHRVTHLRVYPGWRAQA